MSDDWKEGEFSPRDPNAPEEQRTCDVCGFVAKTIQGAAAHKTNKHGKEEKPLTVPGSPGRKPARVQSLQASLAIIGLGLGMIDSYDGAQWMAYVPQQAAALDMAAREYTWAAKACDMLTMAGPVTALASAFLPPVFAILAHHGVLPGAEKVGAMMNNQPPPPPPPAQPAWTPEGDVTINGQTFSSTEPAADLPDELFGASTVVIGDNAPA